MSSDHFARQLRFVVPGACITFWLHTPSLIARIWAEAAPFARFVSVIGLLSVTLIISLLPLQVAGGRVGAVGLPNDHAVLIHLFDSCDQGNSTRRASLIVNSNRVTYVLNLPPSCGFFFLVSIDRGESPESCHPLFLYVGIFPFFLFGKPLQQPFWMGST